MYENHIRVIEDTILLGIFQNKTQKQAVANQWLFRCYEIVTNEESNLSVEHHRSAQWYAH